MKNIIKATIAMTVAAALFTGCESGGGSDGIEGSVPSNDTTQTVNDTAGTNTTSDTETASAVASSLNGVFSYKDLQWQDDGTIEGNNVQYAYRNDYCTSLTTGGYTDWRLPTVSEFRELYEVKDQLDFAWSEETYIYWTADESATSGNEYISMFNLSKGASILFYVDRLDNEGWAARCVRGDQSSADNDDSSDEGSDEITPNGDIVYSSTMKSIFQGTKNRISHISFLHFEDMPTLYFWEESGSYRLQGSESQMNGNAEIPEGIDIENIMENDTFLILKQGERVTFEITYLGAYKNNNIFVKVTRPAYAPFGFNGEEYITVMNPYISNFNDLLSEVSSYGGAEEMYEALFH